MKIVLASRNKKKIRELREMFDAAGLDVEVLSLDDIGYEGEIEEDGSTFEENSIIKASVPASLGYIGIADDSGLCVDALDGAPGIYSARFSEGEPDEGLTKDERNNRRLLRVLENVADGARGAGFVSTIACVIPKDSPVEVPVSDSLRPLTDAERARANGNKVFAVRGECRGVIGHEGRGDNGFGYDPLFYIPELGKTFAELTADEKNAISHRGRAFVQFVKLAAQMAGGKQ